jgi:ribosomal protein S18 acetylase RimI-like enzyme
MVGDRRRAADRPVTVRPATEADVVPLTRLDLTYPAARYLAVQRTGAPPEHPFAFTWRHREAPNRLYADYTPDMLARALENADLVLVAARDGQPAGMLIALLPTWTDAAEITDLAVDFHSRQTGAGRALVNQAVRWARERGRRALWVEPRTDNADAIAFYIALGFRISGFNDRLYTNADDRPGAATVYLHLQFR